MQAHSVTDFGVLEFTTAELKLLPDNVFKFVLAASLITNDIRFHWSLMSRSKADGQSDDLRTMQLVRDLWLMRKLAAVIVEAEICLGSFIGNIQELKQLTTKGVYVLPKAQGNNDYLRIANKLRNQSAYHYDVRGLSSNLDGFPSNAKHKYYGHVQQGNSISAICEQIITIPVIAQSSDSSAVDEFHAWCRDASNSVLQFCNKGLVSVLQTHLPEKVLLLMEVFVGEEAQSPDFRWPLFLAINK